VNKKFRRSDSNPIVQLWKHHYRRSKHEACQSTVCALLWTFSFISTNW